jgi:hypothetical protein
MLMRNTRDPCPDPAVRVGGITPGVSSTHPGVSYTRHVCLALTRVCLTLQHATIRADRSAAGFRLGEDSQGDLVRALLRVSSTHPGVSYTLPG